MFYHSVWLGFELFGLRVQVHSIGYNIYSLTKDMTITIVIINPRQEMGWSVDDVMPRRDGLRIWKILKKIQLRSDHGVEKLGSYQAVERGTRSRSKASLASLQGGASVGTPWLPEEDMGRSPLSEHMSLYTSLTHHRNINPFENKV